MLNKNNERELAYVARVEEIQPIEGYDKVEYARIGAGWWIIVRKDQFKAGDLAIYFEIDSKVPEKEPFMFLEKRHFKVKTIKMCGRISQGLLMSFEDFGWESEDFADGQFLTEKLGVTYAVAEDNKRKAKTLNKYEKMYARHKKLFKNKFLKWVYSKQFGKKILFIFLGKKKKNKNEWPEWVRKTDEDRVQNMPWLFPGNDEEWIATEKVDGSSCTFTVKGFGRKRVFKVCSRNVCFDTETPKKCYYDDLGEGNIYIEMANKYSAKEVMSNMLDHCKEMSQSDVEWLTIQGEVYGGNIQKRKYGDLHDLAVFNIIWGFKDGHTIRLNPIDGQRIATEHGFKYVPIVDTKFKIPKTCEELLSMAGGMSKIDGGMREGIVCRSYDGVKSFKAVDNEYLLKYHN